MIRLLVLAFPFYTFASDQIGSVSTNFRMIGRNDRVSIEAFEDPKVSGVACYLSHAQSGGVKGAMGVAEDPARMGISCSAIGHVSMTQTLPEEPEEVFRHSQSLLFKKLKVLRFVDTKRHVLIYVAVSTKFLSGSPSNTISTVPY